MRMLEPRRAAGAEAGVDCEGLTVADERVLLLPWLALVWELKRPAAAASFSDMITGPSS